MTLVERTQEFVKKWKGKGIDYDKMYGEQCVDAVRQFWHEVHGLSRTQQPNTTPSGGARCLIRNVRLPLRVREKGEAPQIGDVVVWGAMPGNQWGHTAILTEIRDGYIKVFEQDGLNQGDGMQLKVWAINDNIAGYITAA